MTLPYTRAKVSEQVVTAFKLTLLSGCHMGWKTSPELRQSKWRAANETFDLNELSLMTEHFKGNNNEFGQLRPQNPFKESKHLGSHFNSLNLSGQNLPIH